MIHIPIDSYVFGVSSVSFRAHTIFEHDDQKPYEFMRFFSSRISSTAGSVCVYIQYDSPLELITQPFPSIDSDAWISSSLDDNDFPVPGIDVLSYLAIPVFSPWN